MNVTKSSNFGGVLEIGSATDHSAEQVAVIAEFGGLQPDADMHLFLVGVSSLPAQHGKGFTCSDEATSWVFASAIGPYNLADDLLVTIGHELGHIFFGPGHPDMQVHSGPAPLFGTDRSKRLMFSRSGSESRLIVKAEWDKAEVWLVDKTDPEEE